MDAEQLVAAVRVALDETERIARDAAGRIDEMMAWLEVGIPEAERHIARHDPAAVLRRVAADRRVLKRHRPQADVCNYCPVVVWPCPDFADLARGLGIDPEETT